MLSPQGAFHHNGIHSNTCLWHPPGFPRLSFYGSCGSPRNTHTHRCRYITKRLQGRPEVSERIHIFSSFLFAKLNQKGITQEERYEDALKWNRTQVMTVFSCPCAMPLSRLGQMQESLRKPTHSQILLGCQQGTSQRNGGALIVVERRWAGLYGLYLAHICEGASMPYPWPVPGPACA